MFGKGIYFADTFAKSQNYARSGFYSNDSSLMLLCEVALGESKRLYTAQYVEKLEEPY